MQQKWRKLHSLVVFAVVLGLSWFLWAQRLAITDWFKLRGYNPPIAVTQLAADTTMTPQAKHDFYVNHPAIDDKAAFDAVCPSGSEQTIVLGCYHGNQRGIFVYGVSDARLNGVEQVTAAHEMLHAAYDRLSIARRSYVDGLLEAYYKNDLHDQRLLDVIAAYKKSEPHDVVNEMHSVFGTEVAQLPPALETYYRQYFTGRATIVADADSYQAEFTSRQNQVAQDDAQLAQLKTEFMADEADLQTRDSSLRSLQAQMNADKAAGNFPAYNAAVPTYNVDVNAYNEEVAAAEQLIAQYNQLVATRNTIAVEEQQLNQALDSQLAPVPAQQ